MEDRELYFDCDGCRVHLMLEFPAAAGSAVPVLILIPGLTGHIEERHILAVKDAALDSGYAVLRPELYGHGKSDGRFHDHDILIWMHQAMRIIDFADSLPCTEYIVLAGHSQGGLTAVLAGGMMQDRLKALMPLSPAVNIWENAKKGRLFENQFDPENLPETLPCGTGLSGNYLRTAAMLPVEEAIKRFRKPVCIIHGTADVTVPYKYAEWLDQKYADSELVSVEGDDHCFSVHLDLVTETVKHFLRRCRQL